MADSRLCRLMNLHPPHATTPWLKQGMVKFKGLRKGSVAEPIYNHSPDARAKIFQHKHKHANITLSLSSHQNLITSIIHHPTASHQPQSKNTSQNTHTHNFWLMSWSAAKLTQLWEYPESIDSSSVLLGGKKLKCN